MTEKGSQFQHLRTGSIPATEPPFPQSEYQRRIDGVRAKFDAWGIDALVATSLASLTYLTGYTGNGIYFAPFPLVIAPAGKPTYVVRTYEEIAIRTETHIEEVITYTQQGDFAAAWADGLRRYGLENARVGLELGSWNLGAGDVDGLRAQLPGLRVVDATRLVPSVAAVKNDLELAAMRKSMAMTDVAVRTFHDVIRPGVTELEAAEAITAAVEKEGGVLRPFSSLNFGIRTAIPHGKPGAFALQCDQPAVIEVGAFAMGYVAGLVRSAVLGHHRGVERLHEIAEQALAAALAVVRPGARMGDVDAAARRVFAEAGKADAFLHRAGYQNGIGWSYRGNLSIEPDASDVMEEGMTFHLPMFLFDPEPFSTGVSQSIVVTASGAQPLSSTPPTLHRVD